MREEELGYRKFRGNEKWKLEADQGSAVEEEVPWKIEGSVELEYLHASDEGRV